MPSKLSELEDYGGLYKMAADGKTPERCSSIQEWLDWKKTLGSPPVCRAGLTRLIGGVRVSTVFLGIDHSIMSPVLKGPPVLFETMIFGPLGEYQIRCSTWAEAERQHRRAVWYALVRLPYWLLLLGVNRLRRKKSD